MPSEVVVIKIRDIMGTTTSSFEIRGNLVAKFGQEKGDRIYRSLLAGRWPKGWDGK